MTSHTRWPLRLHTGLYLRKRLKAAEQWLNIQGKELVFRTRIRHVSGSRDVQNSKDGLVVVCLIRDGKVYIKEFLKHYRDLGASHLVFLDNGSTDGTQDLLEREPDVTVLSTLAPYKIYKDIMKRYLVNRFGGHGWVLCVDADEFFDYPFRKWIDIHSLLQYLNKNSYTAVASHLLDLFPRGSIVGSDSADWRVEHRFYDLEDIDRRSYADYYLNKNHAPDVDIDILYGGIRSTKFQVRPFLTKHPLIFPSCGIYYVNAHDVRGARVADLSGVLLHYKYVGDFIKYAERIVREKSFWKGSEEYKSYLDAIGRDAEINLHTNTAKELGDIDDLLNQGFLVASESFHRFAERFR